MVSGVKWIASLNDFANGFRRQPTRCRGEMCKQVLCYPTRRRGATERLDPRPRCVNLGYRVAPGGPSGWTPPPPLPSPLATPGGSQSERVELARLLALHFPPLRASDVWRKGWVGQSQMTGVWVEGEGGMEAWVEMEYPFAGYMADSAASFCLSSLYCLVLSDAPVCLLVPPLVRRLRLELCRSRTWAFLDRDSRA